MLDNAPPHSTCNRCPSTRALRLALLLLWAVALAYLSLAPDVKAPSGALGWDKMNHFAAYAVLSLLLIRALLAWRAVPIRLLVVVWATCVAYGALIEGLQWLMALGRTWEWGDILANALGALVACVVFRLALRRFSQTNEHRSP